MKKLNDVFKNESNNRLIGHITQIDYENAIVLSHDFQANSVNSIPKNSFLYIMQEKDNNIENIILLRVKNLSYIDNSAKNNKEETIQKFNKETINKTNEEILNLYNDPISRNKLSFYQLNCKILGTFYNDFKEDKQEFINFGSDCFGFSVSDIYRVYKPTPEQLEFIVNFVKEDRLQATYELIEKQTKINKSKSIILNDFCFKIGSVRYASSKIQQEDKESEVKIYPIDFIKQKTAVFGMTRTGKSNTIKIIADSIIKLGKETNVNIGQIIYDMNGEYANDNDQNKRLINDISCLYSTDFNIIEKNKATAAINNFYIECDYGLNIIKAGIKEKESLSNYVNTFLSIKTIKTNPFFYLLWCLLLHKSGYKFIDNIFLEENKNYQISNFINDCDLIIENHKILLKINYKYFSAIKNHGLLKIFPKITDFFIENKDNCFLEITEQKLKDLEIFLQQQKQNDDTINKLKRIIEEVCKKNYSQALSLLTFIITKDMNSNSKTFISGWQMITPYNLTHYHNSLTDYREEIYEKLKNGKTIIIDFSLGDFELRQYVADEIMSYIFEKQINIFKEGTPPVINVFIEEAHNVLGKKSLDSDLWPRVAKEGAKFNIGVIYATQSPSAISDSMLSQTANFIVAHLNNTQEVSIISQYEDLADFSQSIKQSQDVGFVRLKLLSKTYTIPTQIMLFKQEKKEIEENKNIESKKDFEIIKKPLNFNPNLFKK